MESHKEYLNRILAERAAFKDQWPEFCERCDAAGVIEWTENGAPHGEGFWPMQMADLCGCLEEGKCPRCAVELSDTELEGNVEHCNSCGWAADKPQTHAPAAPDPMDYLMVEQERRAEP